MATVPQVQSENDVFAHIASSGSIPQRYLDRGIDRTGMLSFITRGPARFLGMLHSRYPKSKTVDRRTHMIQEINELDRVLDVTVSSTSADNHTSFCVTNEQAAQLIVQDMLYVKGLYMEIQYTPLQGGQVYQLATGGTVNTVPTTYVPAPIPYPMGNQPTAVKFSANFGQDNTDPTLFFGNYEPLLLIGKGAINSGGAGNTKLTVERCWCTSVGDQGGEIIGRRASALVVAGTNTADAGQIKAGTHQLLRGLPAFPEGGDAPTGLHRNPYMDNNFTQEFKYAVEVTKELSIEENAMNKGYLEIERMVRSRQTMLDKERTFLFGRKGKLFDTVGKATYTMGGVLEFIKRDTSHFLRYANPSLSYPGFLDLTTNIFNLGGGETRDFLCGLELYNELKKAFWSSGNLRYDEDASREFDLPVESIIGASGKMNIIPCYSLSEAGFGNKAIVIDSSLNAFVPTTHKGWDMKVETDIQQKGQQIYKEQLVGIQGLERRYQQYHCVVEFSF